MHHNVKVVHFLTTWIWCMSHCQNQKCCRCFTNLEQWINPRKVAAAIFNFPHGVFLWWLPKFHTRKEGLDAGCTVLQVVLFSYPSEGQGNKIKTFLSALSLHLSEDGECIMGLLATGFCFPSMQGSYLVSFIHFLPSSIMWMLWQLMAVLDARSYKWWSDPVTL